MLRCRNDLNKGDSTVVQARSRSIVVPGTTASAAAQWQPSLLLREQTPAGGDRHRPVLYVHGATFPSANSMMFEFDGISWADTLNAAGISVWAFDFAGFGGSEPYAEMLQLSPPHGEPLGRAWEAAIQIARVVQAIKAESGASRVSIIAHSWGTIATGLFATQNPDLIDRIVFFGPCAQRQNPKDERMIGTWRFLTVEEQHKRFVEDVPPSHPPVLLDRHFTQWAEQYLASDSTSGTRSPASVRTPNGPVADIIATWSGTLCYDPALISAPVAIVRGEWDGVCKDADAAWFLSALTASTEKRDIKIAKGTHLMHLEESRAELYGAALNFLRAL
jgi:pimeloyl-ACP methyl ester carboxylesterase